MFLVYRHVSSITRTPRGARFFFSFSKIIINKRKQYLHTESNRTWEDGRDLRCGWVGVKYIYTGTGSGRGTGCFLSLSDGRHALSVHSVEGRSVSEIWRLRHLCELLDLIVEDEHESAAHSSQHVWPGALEKRPRSLVLDDLLPAIHCALVHDVSWKREAEQTSVMKMGQRPKPWNCDQAHRSKHPEGGVSPEGANLKSVLLPPTGLLCNRWYLEIVAQLNTPEFCWGRGNDSIHKQVWFK